MLQNETQHYHLPSLIFVKDRSCRILFYLKFHNCLYSFVRNSTTRDRDFKACFKYFETFFFFKWQCRYFIIE